MRKWDQFSAEAIEIPKVSRLVMLLKGTSILRSFNLCHYKVLWSIFKNINGDFQSSDNESLLRVTLWALNNFLNDKRYIRTGNWGKKLLDQNILSFLERYKTYKDLIIHSIHLFEFLGKHSCLLTSLGAGESQPQDPRHGGGEPVSTSCPLAFTHTRWLVRNMVRLRNA